MQTALLARTVMAGDLADDGAAWVTQTCDEILALLRQTPATTAQLRERIPALAERLPPPEQGSGANQAPIAPRVLTVLAAGGAVVRGENRGGWTVSRPTWTPTETWLGSPVNRLAETEGYAELVRRWLWAFGPGTEADITWWLGATKSAMRQALTDIAAVPVALQDGSSAWLHPEDLDVVHAGEPWVALLPSLDPTTMGWRGRSFYVDEATAGAVYDRTGNGRPTAWWNGRIVGSWAQQSDGTVVVLPTEQLPAHAHASLQRQAKQLTNWLDGHVVRASFQSPLP